MHVTKVIFNGRIFLSEDKVIALAELEESLLQLLRKYVFVDGALYAVSARIAGWGSTCSVQSSLPYLHNIYLFHSPFQIAMVLIQQCKYHQFFQKVYGSISCILETRYLKRQQHRLLWMAIRKEFSTVEVKIWIAIRSRKVFKRTVEPQSCWRIWEL